MRLKPEEKTTRATLYRNQKVKGDLGTKDELSPLGSPRGSYKKQRGGIVDRITHEISTARVSFAIDYRPKYAEDVQEIHIKDQKYKVVDITNYELKNLTLLFDLELIND